MRVVFIIGLAIVIVVGCAGFNLFDKPDNQ